MTSLGRIDRAQRASDRLIWFVRLLLAAGVVLFLGVVVWLARRLPFGTP